MDDGTRAVGTRTASLQSANGRGGAEKAHGDVDVVVVAGQRVPNSELLMEAGMGVELPSRQPQRKHRLAAQLERARAERMAAPIHT